MKYLLLGLLLSLPLFQACTLMWHINSGGIYETQTVRAMLFRIIITLLFAWISWYSISKNSKPIETGSR